MSDYKVRNEKAEETTAENKDMAVTPTGGKNAAAVAPTTETAPTAAMSEDDVKEIIIEPEEEKIDNVVKLSQKYKFEGKVIEEIDLTGVEEVNGEMAQNVEKLYRKITKTPTASPEITLDYAMAMASTLTGLPVEFFKRINIKDIVKMKNRIVNFLYED